MRMHHKEYYAKNRKRILKYSRKYVRKNRDKINARNRKRYTTDGRWEKQLWGRFKITPEFYWEMFEKQFGLCKICSNPQQKFAGAKLDADHDHATGKMRGLLCRHCNTALGSFKDSVETLLMAVLYLMEYKN